MRADHPGPPMPEYMDGEGRPCNACEAPLTYDAERGIWAGHHQAWCPLWKSKVQPGPTLASDLHRPVTSLDEVVGAPGQPLWKVTYQDRATIGSGVATITTHVRAATYDGAILLIRETVLNAPIKVEACEVREA